MNTITKKQRYLPHELQTRFHACKLYATKEYSIAFITRRYKVSKSSLMRWMGLKSRLLIVLINH